VLASADGKFNSLLPGVELSVLGTSDETVTVDVSKANSQITSAVKDFVAAFY
jgi:flagellar capping protein FliD